MIFPPLKMLTKANTVIKLMNDVTPPSQLSLCVFLCYFFPVHWPFQSQAPTAMMTVSPSEQEWCLHFPNIKWHTLPSAFNCSTKKAKLKKAKKIFFLGDGLKFVLQDKKKEHISFVNLPCFCATQAHLSISRKGSEDAIVTKGDSGTNWTNYCTSLYLSFLICNIKDNNCISALQDHFEELMSYGNAQCYM